MEISNLIHSQLHTSDTRKMSSTVIAQPDIGVTVRPVPWTQSKWAQIDMANLKTLYETSKYHGRFEISFEDIVSSLDDILVSVKAKVTDEEVARGRIEAKKIENHLLEYQNKSTMNAATSAEQTLPAPAETSSLEARVQGVQSSHKRRARLKRDRGKLTGHESMTKRAKQRDTNAEFEARYESTACTEKIQWMPEISAEHTSKGRSVKQIPGFLKTYCVKRIVELLASGEIQKPTTRAEFIPTIYRLCREWCERFVNAPPWEYVIGYIACSGTTNIIQLASLLFNLKIERSTQNCPRSKLHVHGGTPELDYRQLHLQYKSWNEAWKKARDLGKTHEEAAKEGAAAVAAEQQDTPPSDQDADEQQDTPQSDQDADENGIGSRSLQDADDHTDGGGSGRERPSGGGAVIRPSAATTLQSASLPPPPLAVDVAVGVDGPPTSTSLAAPRPSYAIVASAPQAARGTGIARPFSADQAAEMVKAFLGTRARPAATSAAGADIGDADADADTDIAKVSCLPIL